LELQAPAPDTADMLVGAAEKIDMRVVRRGEG